MNVVSVLSGLLRKEGSADLFSGEKKMSLMFSSSRGHYVVRMVSKSEGQTVLKLEGKGLLNIAIT
jgi:hypothetical protein